MATNTSSVVVIHLQKSSKVYYYFTSAHMTHESVANYLLSVSALLMGLYYKFLVLVFISYAQVCVLCVMCMFLQDIILCMYQIVVFKTIYAIIFFYRGDRFETRMTLKPQLRASFGNTYGL